MGPYKDMKSLKSIAEHFNKFFTEIGPNIAKDINPSSVTFKNYLQTLHKNQPEYNLGNKIPGKNHYCIFLTNLWKNEFFQKRLKFRRLRSYLKKEVIQT